jgi:hypothetical protein
VWICFTQAQVLQPNHQSAFEKQHPFNQEVIKKHKIKRISFDIIDKKDFEVAVDKNLTEVYEFNDSALLARYYYTDIVRAIEKEYFTKPVYRRRRIIQPAMRYTKTEYIYDTISTTYMYNDKKQLVLKRYSDGSSVYQSYYYKYDSLNRLVHENRIRETNVSNDKSVFVLGNQVIISTDSFQYKMLNLTQTKQLFINNENRVYKERVIHKNDTINVSDIDENYVAAWLVQKQHFEYINNRLRLAEFTGNANGNVSIKREYTYDAKNELITEKQFKNGNQLQEISYITDDASQLLSSFIIRDAINKTMRIVKLKYDFWSLPAHLNSQK